MLVMHDMSPAPEADCKDSSGWLEQGLGVTIV